MAARPDGVHYTIDNRLKGDYGYSVRTPDGGGLGGNAPVGESEHVGEFPPGEVRIGCYASRRDAEPDLATVKIVAGNSGYRSVELECPGGRAAMGASGSVSGGARGEKGDPVALTRRTFADQIRNGDAVETAGYPESAGAKVVRVVRDGSVIATAEYGRADNGWLQDNYAACEGF